MAVEFSPTHVMSFAARAAELERLGEDRQDPFALVRAARLYTLAVRIADDIDKRPAPPFTQADLARVRDELRALATDASRTRRESYYGIPSRADAAGDLTRAFREAVLRIEQRVGVTDSRREDLRAGA